jgi:sugar phosphate isomerase/epimerase
MLMNNPKYSILDHRIIGWYYPWIMNGLIPTSSPLESKMRLMKSLGYDGVGTSWWELVSYYQERGNLAQLQDISRELQLPLTAYGFVSEGWAFTTGPTHANAMALAKSSLDLAHAAGCRGPYLLGPFDSGDLRQAAKTFRELCQYAQHLQMTLALEFVGISAQLNHLPIVQEFLELADVPNGGVALDSYHFFAGPWAFEGLEAFPASKIQVVHIADAPADLSDPSIELNRLMPGEGQLPLQEFVRILSSKGFEGYWHLECIKGKDYASDLSEVAGPALRLLKRIVESGLSKAPSKL